MDLNDRVITFKTPVEEIAARYPKAVSFLTGRNVRCIRCGEPLWCTIGELFTQDGVADPQQLLNELNDYVKKAYHSVLEITGHRGASGTAPENTISAFEQAISDGADFIETDVQPTKDGKLVLFHDDSLERTTGVSGLLTDRTWDELKNLDTGSWFDSIFSHERIPLLSQTIDVVKNRVRLNIEIKINSLHKEFLDRLVDLLHEKEMLDLCILTSFHKASIEYIRGIDANIKTGVIFDKIVEPLDSILKFPFEVLSVHSGLITYDLVIKAHEKSKEVHVWTVNEEQEMLRLMTFGVDNIITNYPGVLKRILNQDS